MMTTIPTMMISVVAADEEKGQGQSSDPVSWNIMILTVELIHYSSYIDEVPIARLDLSCLENHNIL